MFEAPNCRYPEIRLLPKALCFLGLNRLTQTTRVNRLIAILGGSVDVNAFSKMSAAAGTLVAEIDDTSDLHRPTRTAICYRRG